MGVNQASRLLRRRARMATAPVAMAAMTTVDGSGTAATVISPPVIVGVRPVVVVIDALKYSLLPSVI